MQTKEGLFLAELGINTKEEIEIAYGAKIKITELLKKYKTKQLLIHNVVSVFLDNLKDSDSQALLEMRERNQEEFIKWCAENPHAGVDDEWENEIMFMRDVAKYIEDLVV